ncbi:MAG: DNA-processing protein DprA [Nitrospirota bacterium]
MSEGNANSDAAAPCPPPPGRRLAWVALASTPGMTPRSCASLLAAFGGPEQVLTAPLRDVGAVAGVSPSVARRLTSGESRRLADAALAQSAQLGALTLTPDDPDYPKRLLTLPDPPPALWCRGALEADAAAIAVVGSRRPSHYGQAMAERIGRELSGAGFVVVSGLARGIDAAAHRAALEAGGRTVAVLGCGVDRVYPRENRALQEAIGQRGAVISEFAPGTPPLPGHFPRRNRLISGLALGVVVVEAGDKSGSLITARLALEQGREVFAVPGNVGAGGSVGTNRLIKSGAMLLEGIDDILDAVAAHLDRRSLRRPPANRNQAYGDGGLVLTAEEQNVLEHLTQEPRHVDELAARSGRPIQQIAALLVAMEIKGGVRQLPGNYYCLA